MGEAKMRGDQGVRVANALARIEKLRPDAIICNDCQSKITEIETLDVRSVPGLEAAFAAHCFACKSNTFALQGTEEAILSFYEYMDNVHGEEALIGSQRTKVL